ncbi:uncharacterized protein LOC135341066 isoform X2 [Halichondria panicea]|uniref:uncharacterized protein LOC135341066 isoform X2 n=1 Tax=Halichondria panicea TaxID=6063 RepID=UPI00312BA708
MAQQPTIAKSPEVSNEDSSSLSIVEPQSCSGPDTPRNPPVFDFHSATCASSIMNGLKLRLKNCTTTQLASYTYALYPFMDKCVAVDWKIMVTDDVQSHHIRCHQLQAGDKLSVLLSNFKKQHAKAVILINTQDNYSIVPQFLEGMNKNTIPTVVITQYDGNILLDILDKNRDNVQARLEAESDVDVLVGGGHGHFIGNEPAIRNQKVNKGFGLMEKFTEHMFSEEKRPVLVSNDPAVFTMVMSTLTNYEKWANKDNKHPTVNKALRRIKPHFDKLFNKDLPFYLVFAYRLYIRSAYYQCDDMGKFITACLKKIESFEYKQLAQIINDFIKRGDFQVMYGTTKEEESVSMFSVMECACLVLSKVSQNLESQSQGPANPRPVLPKFCCITMMWLSLALKFHSECSKVTSVNLRDWYDSFFKNHHRIILNDDVIKDLVEGMDFVRLLYLPNELCFKFKHMADLVLSEKFIRPFKHLRNFLHSMELFLETKDELFLMLVNIRANYMSKIMEPGSMAKVSTLGTLNDTITEALNFLDLLLDVWDKRKFRDESIDTECTNWLQLLLGLVEITRDHSHTLLNSFLRKYGVCKKYKKLICKQILETVEQNFGKLSIEQFFILYKAFIIWPNKKLPRGTLFNDH